MVSLASASCAATGHPTPAEAAPAAAPSITDANPADSLADPTIRGALSPSGIPMQVLDVSRWSATVRTPCGAEAVLGSWAPLTAVDVVLDPGHGGRQDTGALSPSGDRTESDLNLQVVQAIGEELDRRGITWASTRSGDYAVLLSVRAEFADAMAARLMVSVHHNAPASATSDTPGTEVYIQSENPASSRLGGLLYDHVVAALQPFDVQWTRAHDAGVLSVLTSDAKDAYGVLRRPATPTVLLEAGYLANPAEASLFGTGAYLDAMGRSVADAIQTYLETEDPPVQQPGTPRSFAGVHAPSASTCAETPLEP